MWSTSIAGGAVLSVAIVVVGSGSGSDSDSGSGSRSNLVSGSGNWVSVSGSISSCSGSKLWKDADSVVPVPGLHGGLENAFVVLPTRWYGFGVDNVGVAGCLLFQYEYGCRSSSESSSGSLKDVLSCRSRSWGLPAHKWFRQCRCRSVRV